MISTVSPALLFNFMTGPLHPLTSFARTSVATRFNQRGLLETVPAGVPRFDYWPFDGIPGQNGAPRGLLFELAATNECLRSRDMTNAAWSKSNVTAALDQTGIDGVANAASSLTATAGNGTCLQAITSASSARRFSAYVKRITGTGAISLTLDNGATFTDISAQLSSARFARVAIGQTLANPSVGFRIATSGDKIAVDYVQEETGVLDTTAILTTGATATRAAEVASLPLSSVPNFNPIQGTLFTEAELASYSSQGMTIVGLNDGTVNNDVVLANGGPATLVNGFMNFGSVQQANINISGPAVNSPFRAAFRYSTNDVNLAVGGFVGSAVTSAAVPTGLSGMSIGSGATGNNGMIGRIRQLALIPRGLSDIELQRLTL